MLLMASEMLEIAFVFLNVIVRVTDCKLMCFGVQLRLVKSKNHFQSEH